VFQRGVTPDAVFLFKHALVQDTAYSTLLRGLRQALHAQIAQALECHSPEMMENQPELFALHYAEANFVEQSVAYWGKAGHRSVARSAMAEAATQFQKGLDQLALLPTLPNVGDKSWNFAAPSAQRSSRSKVRRRRKRGESLRARRSCGNNWVPPRSSFRVRLGSQRIT
jgi:hypothetical protein